MKINLANFKNRIYVIAGIAVLVIGITVITGLWLYNGSISNTKISLFKKLNLPVARVGTNVIKGGELFDRYELASQLYQGNTEFNPATAQDGILDRLIQEQQVQAVADKRGISVSGAEINSEYQRLADKVGGPDKLQQMLEQTYHFTPEQFKDKGIKPDLLRTKLAISFYEDKGLNPELYQTLQLIQDKINQNVSFADLAKTYSEDPTSRQFGGDNGEIPIKDLAPEFQKAVQELQPGQTATITTRLGIYIVKMVSRKDTGQTATINFLGIYLDRGNRDQSAKQSAFEDWYVQQIKNIQIKKYINI